MEQDPLFVDAYFDHSRNGLLVIQFTAIDEAITELLRVRMPETSDVEMTIVPRSRELLYDAMHKVWDMWPGSERELLSSVSMNPKTNGLTVEVIKEGTTLGLEMVEVLSDDLGVPVGLEVVAPAFEAVRTSTANCHTPMKGGIRIYGPISGQPTKICTMGFHVQVGADEQFVTAGHCAYGYLPIWEHPSGTNRGSRTATQYHSNGRDIQRVQMSDSQDSSVLYASATNVTTALDTYVGEPICASRGWSGTAWGCGVVQDNVTTWTGGGCGCTINGGDSSVASVGGDSGSPMVDQAAKQVGLGLLNTTSGLFARLDDALDAWGITVRTP